MVIYSHSSLSAYETCPLMFKFKHIDGLKEEKEGIEAFLGTQVHEAIHYIHKKVQIGKLPSLKEVLEYYKDLWKRKFHENIKIVKDHLSEEDYFQQGVEMISKYYKKNKPFDENIIGMEQKIIVDLKGDGKYVLRGFIDKLIHNKEKGEYEIHDYKSGSWLPEQEELDKDRQLALYSMGVKDLYPDAKNIILKWHYLKHGQELTSNRTDKQLEQLKKEIIELIKKIEVETEWPAKRSKLCDWCGFNHICPDYKESKKLLPF